MPNPEISFNGSCVLFLALAFILATSGVSSALVGDKATAEPALHISLSPENPQIDLDARKVERGALLNHLARRLPLHWAGAVPGADEWMTLSFSGLSLDQALRKILAPGSFLLLQSGSPNHRIWKLLFLNRRGTGVERDPLDPSLLVALDQFGNRREGERESVRALEEVVFYGKEADVYRILNLAAEHPSASVRRGAEALLENLGPAWELPL